MGAAGPLPDGALEAVARGVKNDDAEPYRCPSEKPAT